jgi:hypothetical protein
MLDTRGVVDVRIGDLDHDGAPDLAFANSDGGWLAGWSPNFVYWGDGTRNYSVARRTEIPSYYTTGMAQADLDDDGWVDLVFSEGEIAAGKPRTLEGLFLWWGSKSGFSAERRAVLSANIPENGVRVADLNRDGYLDLIAGADDNDGRGKRGFVVLWGSAHGYSATRKQVFRVGGSSRVPLVADLNGDGWLDLACAPEDVKGLYIFWGSPRGVDPERYTVLPSDREYAFPEAADLDRDGFLDLVLPTRKIGERTEGDSFVYYGSAAGFSSERRIGLPSMAGYDPSIADLNRDGWLDIVMPNYSARELGKRSIPTYVYWGGPRGFDPKARLELPADAGAGTLVADFDGDGWLDLFIACHRRDGSKDLPGKPNVHHADSLIYWNGPGGLGAIPPTRLPSVGPHVLMAADVGSISNRELAEYYTSAPYRSTGPDGLVRTVSWKADTPFGTAVEIQLRSGSTSAELLAAQWHGPSGPGSWYGRSGAAVTGVRGRWLQYRARLSTPNGGPTPYLYEVSIGID